MSNVRDSGRGGHTRGRAGSIAWAPQQAGHTALAFWGMGAQTTTAVSVSLPLPLSHPRRGTESTFFSSFLRGLAF